MIDINKEAFEKWVEVAYSPTSSLAAWQAACEFKQKEIDILKNHDIAGYKEGIDCLQAENKKLRNALEFYADVTNNPKQYMRQGYLVYNLKKNIFVDGGTIAREALKEVGEK